MGKKIRIGVDKASVLDIINRPFALVNHVINFR